MNTIGPVKEISRYSDGNFLRSWNSPPIHLETPMTKIILETTYTCRYSPYGTENIPCEFN